VRDRGDTVFPQLDGTQKLATLGLRRQSGLTPYKGCLACAYSLNSKQHPGHPPPADQSSSLPDSSTQAW
jgi:hypothetical protein